MELVSGHTLRELIHQGERLPLNRALEIAEGILAGLEYSNCSLFFCSMSSLFSDSDTYLF
jgi:serine/threonine protein kinase